MATTPTPTPSKKIIQDSEAMWDKFVKISKICGILIVLVLAFMGLTLV